MCIPLRSQTPRCASYCAVRLHGVLHTGEASYTCASHRGAWFRGVHPTTESSSAVCITLLSQAPRCASYCGVKLPGVHHTSESDSGVCIIPHVKLRGVHPTAESSSAVYIPSQSRAPWCESHRRVNCTKFLKKLCSVHPTAAGLGIRSTDFRANRLFVCPKMSK